MCHLYARFPMTKWEEKKSRTYSSGEETICEIVLEYSENGRVKERNIQYGSQSAHAMYKYDFYGRLIEGNMTGTNVPKDPFGTEITNFSYQYDDFNNISSSTTVFKNEEENVTTFTYDDVNPCKLINVTHSHSQYPSELQLQYDDSGNITFDGIEKTFAYDPFEKLASIDTVEKKWEYKNDFCWASIFAE
ncbi:hypothetical protein BC1_00023 [Bacillus phage BC-1]|nr:hypothetical protein BC1_00023 [Bacillus phage BC-1]